MKVAVFGLGYVGCVSAAALAKLGHEVIGVDNNPAKVSQVAAGEAPVLEPGLSELMAEQVASGALSAVTDGERAMAAAEAALICVGTPSRPNGELATDALERVSETIGAGLAGRDGGARATVVVRSTSIPGSTEGLVGATIGRISGSVPGEGFGLAMNPEFLREGSSLTDFFAPPKTVIGELDSASGDVVQALYDGIPGGVHRVPIRVAEMVKYADNAFHALKISFANEIGTLCKALELDSHAVMDVFCADTKLNISTAYLRPGFSFGGSCLPKDLRALVHTGRRLDLELPLLESILPSNERHLQRAMDAITASGHRRVGLFGLSFKPGTDDLRESPLVELAERLIGKGFELRIYDPTVSLSRLVGANREYIETRLPHLSALLTTNIDDVLAHSEVCVVGARSPELERALGGAVSKIVIDLVRLPRETLPATQDGYVGIAW